MSNFNGTWKTDKSSINSDQYNAVMDEMGMSAAKEKLRDAVTTLVYNVTGDKWVVDVEVDKYPGLKENYKLTVGQKLSGKGLDGSNFENTVTVVNENKINEACRRQDSSGNWIDFKVTREVKGNIMDVCMECNGKTLQMKMLKA